MTTGQDDAALLAKVVEGDHDAFATLMRRHEDRVFAVCLRIMGNRTAALDATQETFLTLYRKASQYRATAAVGHLALPDRGQHLLRPAPQGTSPTVGGDADLSRPRRPARQRIRYTSVELRPSVEAALATLTPDFRAVVVLSDIEGMSLPEVAEALEVPVGTVKSRLFRARRQLAGVLGNLSDGSEHQTGTEP